MSGHVFVIQGDIRRLACDAYLFATDRRLNDDGGWTRSAPDASARLDPALVDDFKHERRFTLPLVARHGVRSEPRTVLTAVPYYGFKEVAELTPRVLEFFEVAAELIRSRPESLPKEKRGRALVALPVFAIGGGGGGHVRGDILRHMLALASQAAARYGYDVALVTRSQRDYAFAQSVRRSRSEFAWPELAPERVATARHLGNIARQARLVPFMGAGISISGGAPSWEDLIATLSVAAGIEPDVLVGLQDKHDVLDQAAYVRHEFNQRTRDGGSDFIATIIDAVDVRRYGLLPPMLASLEAEQAITLNYDRLFEWAASDALKPRRVIPGEHGTHERWLLKLHGSVENRESIVLTRDDYLGFNADRAALSSLVKATLMTRHLLFVGFGMSDPHFHEIVHDVRRAVPGREGKLGTVLTLDDDQVMRRLWRDDLDFVVFDSPRELEIFVDALLAFGTTSTSFLLAAGYESALDAGDAAVREAFTSMLTSIPPEAEEGASWPAVARLLNELGAGDDGPRAPRELPEGLTE